MNHFELHRNGSCDLVSRTPNVNAMGSLWCSIQFVPNTMDLFVSIIMSESTCLLAAITWLEPLGWILKPHHLVLVIFFLLPLFLLFSFLLCVGKLKGITQSPISVESTSHLHMLNYQRLVHLRVSQVEDAAKSILVQLNLHNKFLAPLPGIGNIAWFVFVFILYFS